MLHVGDVVSDVTPMLRRLLGETIDLKAVVGERGHVRADAGQLQQVLINIVVNARDAMPNGGRVTIETADVVLDEDYVRLHAGAQPGRHVLLAISDTGQGMDGETQRRVFEPFFTTKAKGHGTGLGLATVHGIVKQSGGNIWVYSELGRGTAFKIYLPCTDEPTDAPAAPQLDRTTLHGTDTLLLVEDEELVRDFATLALTRFGYTVYGFGVPQQAIAFAESFSGPIDLLVTDVVLPEISGRAMSERIRALHPETKVLFISGYADTAIVRHGVLEEGMAFLEKPFAPAALGQKVREVLADGRGAAPGGPGSRGAMRRESPT